MKTIFPETEVGTLLCDLIAAKSINPPGNEIEAAKVLASFFERKGIPYHLEYVQKNRPNIIAKVKGKCNTPKILLTSHLDVVPEGDLNNWKTTPFQAVIKEGTLYGRGACDAKGSLAALAVAFATLVENRNNIKGDLTFAGVMGEETGGQGSKALVNRGIESDAVILGEPTDMEVCIAHKGRMQIDVELTGQAAHTSQPDKGVNAVLEAVRLIDMITKLQKKIEQRNNPLVGKASLTITAIDGGGRRTIVPQRCIFQLDRRLIPDEKSETAEKEFQELITKFLHTSKAKVKAEYQVTTKSYMGSDNWLLVKAAQETIGAIKGRKTTPKGFGAGCDMYIFGQRRGCSVIVLGPGRLELAHNTNEHIDLSEIRSAVLIYIKIIEKLWHDWKS